MKLVLPILVMLFVLLGCVDFRTRKNEFKNKRPVVTETVAIAPGEWREWAFQVTESEARLNGSYATQGGVDHEIEFWVVEDKYKDQIMQKGTGRFVYRSTETGTGRHRQTILREIDPGNYYVLFRNESKSRTQTVKVSIYVEW